ncbi:MAG: hypothetical protein M1540_05010 [Candidatus Bathyarchaeota archaeon]|nr:hypothetical protein [Candidatus Bathyarchaeota archaeon]
MNSTRLFYPDPEGIRSFVLLEEAATTSQQPEPDAENKAQSLAQPVGCCCV